MINRSLLARGARLRCAAHWIRACGSGAHGTGRIVHGASQRFGPVGTRHRRAPAALILIHPRPKQREVVLHRVGGVQ